MQVVQTPSLPLQSDILFHIFKHLTPLDRTSFARVCKATNKVYNDNCRFLNLIDHRPYVKQIWDKKREIEKITNRINCCKRIPKLDLDRGEVMGCLSFCSCISSIVLFSLGIVNMPDCCCGCGFSEKTACILVSTGGGTCAPTLAFFICALYAEGRRCCECCNCGRMIDERIGLLEWEKDRKKAEMRELQNQFPRKLKMLDQ